MHSGLNSTCTEHSQKQERRPLHPMIFNSDPTSIHQAEYSLTVRQQPQKARLCSFKDKGFYRIQDMI